MALNVLLLRNVSNQVNFENTLNHPVGSKPANASNPNSGVLISLPNALYKHPTSVSCSSIKYSITA